MGKPLGEGLHEIRNTPWCADDIHWDDQMIPPDKLHGKRLAMVAWAKKEGGEDDVRVFAGTADWNGETLTVRREPIDSSFEVQAEWLERIKGVTPDLKKTLLGADYSFSVNVGDISEAANPSELQKTGLNWKKATGSIISGECEPMTYFTDLEPIFRAFGARGTNTIG